MNTVNPLKRPSPEPIDPLKLLVCKICDKGDVLSLKTCGCLLCDSCDGDSRNICISCRSNVDPKIKLSFTKNPRCKSYQPDQCNRHAEYKCNCIPNCFVCSSCLTYIHRKRVRGSCVPEVLSPKVTTNHETCELCKDFTADFKLPYAPYTKICFACKTNFTIDLEEIINEAPDWNHFYREYEQSSENVSNKIKKIEDELESSSLAREEEVKKCKDAISEIQKRLDEHTEQYDQDIAKLKQQLDNFKKISNILKPDGTIKTILDLLKDEQLNLHGEQAKEQTINLLNSFPGKECFDSISNPKTKLVQIFIAREDSMRYSVTSILLPGFRKDLNAIVFDRARPIYLSVVKQSKVNDRLKLSKEIEKRQDKWVRKDHFDVDDIVIVSFMSTTSAKKFSRAKILSKGNDYSTALLLDLGVTAKVPNSSVGEINGIKINDKPTCFVAQLSELEERILLHNGRHQFDGVPKAMQIIY
ncbi:uncharacterized protein LOC107360862 [Tetranychus urticae]|nr:uncharacterized protein LOC107360862 [Tetranychus urticae]